MLATDGIKTSIAKKWAGIIGVSLPHFYRIINNGNGNGKKKSTPYKPEYYDWAKVVVQIKKSPPEEAGELSTEDALALAVKGRLLPDAASSVPVGTYNLIIRKLGFNKPERKCRFQASRPNLAHHFDASTSRYFYISRKLDNGDYLLNIHRPARHYKNKPIPVDALRPWIYGLVDDYSGRLIARYTPAQGETSSDSMLFLSWALAEIGLPEKLFSDQGMLKKCLASSDLIARLGIELPQAMPYAKEAHGKIERPWRTIWKKFERPFFAAHEKYEKFEITLSEMNSQLQNFISDKYNQLPHRFEKEITRLQAWNKINLHGGIVKIPENAIATAAKRNKRKVDDSGLLQYEGNLYEVKGLNSAWVYVYEGIFDDRLMVQDIETGMKYEVRDFRPLDIGQYRAAPMTAYEKLVSLSACMPTDLPTLYSDKKPKDPKVASFPIRTKEKRQIENPLSLPDKYTNVDEAMKKFIKYLPGIFLSASDREAIESEIEANGLNRSFVENFALEVRAQLARRQAI